MTTPSEVWAYVAPKMTESHEWISDLHRVHGLRSGTQLTVSQTQRIADTVEQSIAEAGGTVTVERQP